MSETREEVRERGLAALPSWYSPGLHLAIPSVFGLAIIAFAIASIHDLRPLELLTVPLMYVISNASEWRAHRDLLHKRSRLAPVLYDRHTPLHHVVYTTDAMAIRERRELGLILIPAYGILLIFLGTCPVTIALVYFGQRNVAALFAATAMGYVLSYEWLHLSFHLAPESRIGRLWIVRALRDQHALHHDPKHMLRYNFNVTVPLWDWVRGTRLRR